MVCAPLIKSVSRRGGRNKGGRKQMRANANKRRQTLTNASKRRGENARANASKREQTWINANKRLHPPPFIAVFYTPFAIPLLSRYDENGKTRKSGRKPSLMIKLLGRIFLGHQGPRRRDIPDKNFMQVAFFCCFRQGVAGMSRDLGRDVPGLEKLCARELWADFLFLKKNLKNNLRREQKS